MPIMFLIEVEDLTIPPRVEQVFVNQSVSITLLFAAIGSILFIVATSYLNQVG